MGQFKDNAEVIANVVMKNMNNRPTSLRKKRKTKQIRAELRITSLN